MPKCRPVRLVLETLEDRDLLSTYFVSTVGVDGAAGASDSPWRTLQYAANHVAAGDTVVVRAGNYTGFNLTTDGTAAARITFSADSGVTINTANTWNNLDGINLEGADYVTIQGFNVVGVSRAGIRSVTNHDVIIRNNVADRNGVWGIFTGFSDDILIENNVASRSVQQHGIYVSNSGDRPVIRNNTVWGNNDAGIHMNGDISQGGDGIITGALVEGNTIYDNGLGGGSAINADGVQGSTFRNNLLYNNHASGISLFRIDGGGPSTGNVVVNNTILQASDGRWAVNIQNASTGNKLYNNILYSYHSFRGVIDISSDSLTGFVSDYNSVMDRFTTNGGSTVLTLAQWQAQTGQDTHSIRATPTDLFVNPSANDYHLKTGSPAIDTGTATNAPTTDHDGNPRPSGSGYDIGAYEYQSTTTPPPSPGGTFNYPSGSVNVPIRDLQTATATVVVPDHRTIADLNVTINVAHTYDADLVIKLRAPDGREVTLSDRNGKSKDNYTNTTFDDEASKSINAGAAPFTGSFRPESPLGVFDGADAYGTWTLVVSDVSNRDQGTLLNFTITVTTNGTTGGASASGVSITAMSVTSDTTSQMSAAGTTTTAGTGETASLTWVQTPAAGTDARQEDPAPGGMRVATTSTESQPALTGPAAPTSTTTVGNDDTTSADEMLDALFVQF